MKLTDFIFCEDIRDELHNKVSLIGIYNNKIRINTADGTKPIRPVIMPCLAIFARWEAESLRKVEKIASFDVHIKSGADDLFKGVIALNDKRDQTVSLKLRLTPFVLNVGSTDFLIRVLGKDNSVLATVSKSLLVELHATPKSNVSQPGQA